MCLQSIKSVISWVSSLGELLLRSWGQETALLQQNWVFALHWEGLEGMSSSRWAACVPTMPLFYELLFSVERDGAQFWGMNWKCANREKEQFTNTKVHRIKQSMKLKRVTWLSLCSILSYREKQGFGVSKGWQWGTEPRMSAVDREATGRRVE